MDLADARDMYLRCERYRPLVHTPLIARSSLQYTGVSHFYTISPMQCSKLCSSEELFLFPFPSFLLKICRRASFVVVVVTHRRAFQITWSGALHEQRTMDVRFSPFHAAIFTVILCRTSRLSVPPPYLPESCRSASLPPQCASSKEGQFVGASGISC